MMQKEELLLSVAVGKAIFFAMAAKVKKAQTKQQNRIGFINKGARN